MWLNCVWCLTLGSVFWIMFWIVYSVQTVVFWCVSPHSPSTKHVFSTLLFVVASMIITYQGTVCGAWFWELCFELCFGFRLQCKQLCFEFCPPTAPPPKHVFSALLFVMASMIITYQGSAHCDEILATHPTHFCLPPAEADELTACAFVYLAVW